MDRSAPTLVRYEGSRDVSRSRRARRATFIAHEAWPNGRAGAFVPRQGGFLWFEDRDAMFDYIAEHLVHLDGRVGWWGTFSTLRSSGDRFPRGIRADFYFEVFGAVRSDPIPSGLVGRFVAWLRDWGL